MEAIKKKMQAMKLEKDNAADRADVAEQQSKEAVLRAEKVRLVFDRLVSRSIKIWDKISFAS